MIEPQVAEAALMHSAGNRQASFTTVKAYAADMVKGDWAATGETITASDNKRDRAERRAPLRWRRAGCRSRRARRLCYYWLGWR